MLLSALQACPRRAVAAVSKSWITKLFKLIIGFVIVLLISLTNQVTSMYWTCSTLSHYVTSTDPSIYLLGAKCTGELCTERGAASGFHWVSQNTRHFYHDSALLSES